MVGDMMSSLMDGWGRVLSVPEGLSGKFLLAGPYLHAVPAAAAARMKGVSRATIRPCSTGPPGARLAAVRAWVMAPVTWGVGLEGRQGQARVCESREFEVLKPQPQKRAEDR